MVPSRSRVIIAFALAPMAPAVLVSIIMLGARPHDVGFAEMFVSIFRWGLVVAYTITAVIGFPIYVVVRRFWDLTGNVCIIGGMLSGALAFIIIMIPALVEHPSLIGFIFGASLGYAAFGAIAGFAFWKLVSIGGHTN